MPAYRVTIKFTAFEEAVIEAKSKNDAEGMIRKAVHYNVDMPEGNETLCGGERLEVSAEMIKDKD